jgi:hypothetical protein
MKTIIGIGATLLTAWIIWVSTTLVDTQVTIELVEYKIDSLNPLLHEIAIKD